MKISAYNSDNNVVEIVQSTLMASYNSQTNKVEISYKTSWDSKVRDLVRLLQRLMIPFQDALDGELVASIGDYKNRIRVPIEDFPAHVESVENPKVKKQLLSSLIPNLDTYKRQTLNRCGKGVEYAD